MCYGFCTCRNALMDVYLIKTNNHHASGERHRFSELSNHQSIQKDTYISDERYSWRNADNYIRELPQPLCFGLPTIMYFEFIP